MLLADAVQNHTWTHDSAYEPHWEPRLRQFRNVRDPRLYVPSAKYETGTQRMRYRIQVCKGIVMWIGEIRSGKTLISPAMILKRPQARYTIELASHLTVPRNEVHGDILLQLRLGPFRSEAHWSNKSGLRRCIDKPMPAQR